VLLHKKKDAVLERLRLRYLIARRLPLSTQVREESPSGAIILRRDWEAVKKPIEEHTGAKTPTEPG